jgi:hypothetical protein
MVRSPHQTQRGAAALTITLVLFFVMTLVAAFANRNHMLEQRASANQLRATQAFEAAEAGIEWTIAMLNNPQPIDDRCGATNADAARSFRERYLAADRFSGMQRPATRMQDGKAVALQAACVRSSTGWDCSCPAGGTASLSPPAIDGAAPAFTVQFTAAPQPGVVQLLATGCSSLGGECAVPGSTGTDAVAHVQVLLGLVPGLSTPPAAPLTVKGAVQAGDAQIGLFNADASSGGATVHAGALVNAPSARLATVAGGAAALSAIESDAALAAATTDRFFAAFFGVDKALWQQHPGVAHLRCSGDCASALAQAIGSAATHRMVWIDGDAHIDGPLVLGTPQQPVIVIVNGSMTLGAGVTLHGLLYATQLVWNDAVAGTAAVHGAAISEGNYQGSGAPDFVYDSAILASLKTGTGSFARLPGSWKDF